MRHYRIHLGCCEGITWILYRCQQNDNGSSQSGNLPREVHLLVVGWDAYPWRSHNNIMTNTAVASSGLPTLRWPPCSIWAMPSSWQQHKPATSQYHDDLHGEWIIQQANVSGDQCNTVVPCIYHSPVAMSTHIVKYYYIRTTTDISWCIIMFIQKTCSNCKSPLAWTNK